MEKKTGYLAVALSYVGAFVGAGFISGQELAQFFIRFGNWGWVIWGATVLTISLGGGVVLGWIVKQRFDSFKELAGRLFGKRIAMGVCGIVNGYLIGGLIIMMSGAGNLISELFGVGLVTGVIIITFLILFVIWGGGERLLKVNRVLVPILIVSTFFITIKLAIEPHMGREGIIWLIKNPSPMLINPVISYLLYIGYNALGAIVALVNISKETDGRNGLKGGIVGGLIISVLGSLLLYALWVTYPEWQSADLPITYILKNRWLYLYYFFVPSILIAMFTVAIAYALGISRYINRQFGVSFKAACLVLVIIVAPVAMLGFSKLLGIIYPFFGIMATLILMAVLVRLFINKEKI